MPPVEGLDLVGHCGIPRPVLQEILVTRGRGARCEHSHGRHVESTAR